MECVLPFYTHSVRVYVWSSKIIGRDKTGTYFWCIEQDQLGQNIQYVSSALEAGVTVTVSALSGSIASLQFTGTPLEHTKQCIIFISVCSTVKAAYRNKAAFLSFQNIL